MLKDTMKPRFRPKQFFLQSPLFKGHIAYNYSHIQQLIFTPELQKDQKQGQEQSWDSSQGPSKLWLLFSVLYFSYQAGTNLPFFSFPVLRNVNKFAGPCETSLGCFDSSHSCTVPVTQVSGGCQEYLRVGTGFNAEAGTSTIAGVVDAIHPHKKVTVAEYLFKKIPPFLFLQIFPEW